MRNPTKISFWLDVVLLLTFLLTALSGLVLWLAPHGGGGGGRDVWGLWPRVWKDVHIYVGLALLAVATIHLVRHWNWIVYVPKRLFRKTSNATRFHYGVDVVIFLFFALVNLSGLLAWLVFGHGVPGGGNAQTMVLSLSRRAWSDIHLWTGIGMSALGVAHFALHWKWLVCQIRSFSRRSYRLENAEHCPQ